MSLAIIGVIASEMLASLYGLGYLIDYAFTSIQIPKIYGLVVVTLGIAYGLNRASRAGLAVLLKRAHHHHQSL